MRQYPPMDILAALEQSLDVSRRRYSDFPSGWAMILRLIKHINVEVNKDADVLLGAWGVSYAEYGILLMLYGAESYTLPVTTLCKFVDEKPDKIRRLIHLVSEKELVLRSTDPMDRRKIMLTLSDAGESLMERFLPVASGLLEQKALAFEAGEMAELERLLKKLAHNMEGTP